jgi:hypothetical protein
VCFLVKKKKYYGILKDKVKYRLLFNVTKLQKGSRE